MAIGPRERRRLEDLLIEPRESLEIELKSWLDITQDQGHRATLAKALIALANHGGGYVILGLEQREDGAVEAPERPADLASYDTDTVNAVVARFAEPVFHCDVIIGTAPGGERYPIISVPGGYSAPIRSCRDGPNGEIRQFAYYVRRPGPQSDTPRTGQEWDQLVRRCIANARDDLVDQIRSILAGGPPEAQSPGDEELLERWLRTSLERRAEVLADLPPDSPSRTPLGYYAIAYRLVGELDAINLGELRNRMHAGVVRHTGWPPFWVPTRREILPRSVNDTIECWLARDDPANTDPAHADFWRATARGEFFLCRGYQEDGADRGRLERGEGFDITLPTWRLGEVLLHAESMARQLGDPAAQVFLVAEWTGLEGRRIASLSVHRPILGTYISHQRTFRASLNVQADRTSESLPELVARVMRPLYELFDFFNLPDELVSQELARMRANRF